MWQYTQRFLGQLQPGEALPAEPHFCAAREKDFQRMQFVGLCWATPQIALTSAFLPAPVWILGGCAEWGRECHYMGTYLTKLFPHREEMIRAKGWHDIFQSSRLTKGLHRILGCEFLCCSTSGQQEKRRME
ncbi:unnamed protein product [Lepidochelys olivacea]